MSSEKGYKHGTDDQDQKQPNLWPPTSQIQQPLLPRLHKPTFILAPMVMGSELAYRMLVRNYGVDICYSPMLRASVVIKGYQQLCLAWEQCQHCAYYNDDDDSTSTTRNKGPTAAWFRATFTEKGEHLGKGLDSTALSYASPCSFLDSLLATVSNKNAASSSSSSVHDDILLAFADFHPDEISTLVIQLCGNDPLELGLASKILLEYYTTTTTTATDNRKDETSMTTLLGIDFNLGCPQTCAKTNTFGAFLAEEHPQLAMECIQAMRKAMDEYRREHCNVITPSNHHRKSPNCQTSRRLRLSCKIRLSPHDDHHDQDIKNSHTLQYAQSLVDAGCELLAVHCRRRSDKNVGSSERQIGYQLVSMLDIPVVLNGGMTSMTSAQQMLDECPNVAGLMMAQGMLENPRMLMSTLSSHVEDPIAYPASVATEYLDYAEQFPPPSPLFVRRHLRWIFRAQLQPTQRYPDPSEYKTNWRVQLWTFLVRPYLTHVDQFRLVVLLYVQWSGCPMPDSLRRHSHRLLSSEEKCQEDATQTISFSTIRHYQPTAPYE